MEEKLSHIDAGKKPGMVDVSHKSETVRIAEAESTVFLGKDIMKHLADNELQLEKGPVFQTAIIAGTIAAKKCADLIPLCHPLPLQSIKLSIKPLNAEQIEIRSQIKVSGKTGVEMEALTAVSVAALTVYDMCKAMSHGIVIEQTRLISKSGGKSDYNSKD